MPQNMIVFSVFGDTQFARRLRLVGKRARAGRPIYEATAFFLSKVQREQFATQGERSGHAWTPLAPSTVARKGSETILVDSGALRDSFQYGDENSIWEVTDDFLHWGSENEYGIFHQLGTRDLPIRKPFELTEADKVAIVKSWQRWVVEGEIINLEFGIV